MPAKSTHPTIFPVTLSEKGFRELVSMVIDVVWEAFEKKEGARRKDLTQRSKKKLKAV